MKTSGAKAVVILIELFMVISFLSFHRATAQGLTFTTNTFTTGNGPYSVVATDINGDGRLDLASANLTDNTVRVLTNNGSGSFAFAFQRSMGGAPKCVSATDVNGDGKVDLVCADNASLTVLTNNGSGVLGSNATVKAQLYVPCVTTADVNGDSKPDLVCVNNNIQNGSPALTLFTNNGSGIFSSNATLTVGDQPLFVTAVDINGDGYVDLVSANYGAKTLTVLTNNGSGVFGLNATLNLGRRPYCVAAASINNNGKLDLISADQDTSTLTVLTNNGSGIFGSNATLVAGYHPSFVVAADLNGDGFVDLISAGLDAGSSLTVFTNNGTGGFGFNTTLKVGVFAGGGARCVIAADLNSDGKMDLVAANSGGNTLTVLLNTSSFPPPTIVPALSFNQQGQGMNVNWPSASFGWSLQENSNLAQPNWLPSGYGGYSIADNGTNKSLFLPKLTGSRFFRLLHP